MPLKLFVAAAVFGVTALSAPAYAQVGIQFGIGGPAYSPPHYYQPPAYRREVERPVYRGRPVIDDDDDEECRMVTRRSANRYGQVVIRRVQVCD